jgi:hypothetical protein
LGLGVSAEVGHGLNAKFRKLWHDTFLSDAWQDAEFMDDVRQATLRGAHPAAQLLFYVLLGFLALFLLWAAFARLDEVTHAPGQVIPSGKVQLVGSPERQRRMTTNSGQRPPRQATLFADALNRLEQQNVRRLVHEIVAPVNLVKAANRIGNNLYDFTGTGTLVTAIDTPKSAGIGSIQSGTLELSNVDLTEQFSDLITTQRSFQAGSRLITVSDTVLEDIVNLKR